MLESTQRATNLARPQAQNAARTLPLLRLGRAREVGRRSLRRRAAPARARARRRLGRELPRARRADEPSRSRVARGARGRARGVPRDDPARLARPRARRRRRRADARARGPDDPQLRRRLGRVRPPPRRAGSRDSWLEPELLGAEAEAKTKPAAAEPRTKPSGRASSSSSSPRSRHARRRSPGSSASSPTTGPTSRRSRRTGARATSSSRCSAAGRSCSKARRGDDAAEVAQRVDDAGLRLVRFLWCGNDGTVRAKASGRQGLEGRIAARHRPDGGDAGDERARPAAAGRGDGPCRRDPARARPRDFPRPAVRAPHGRDARRPRHAGRRACAAMPALVPEADGGAPRRAGRRAARGRVRERVRAGRPRRTAATCRSTRASASRRSA